MFLLRSNLILLSLALFTPFFYLLKVNIFEITLNDTYSLIFFSNFNIFGINIYKLLFIKISENKFKLNFSNNNFY